MRRLIPICFLLLIVGCGRSTAYWVEQLKSANPGDRLHAVHALQGQSGDRDAVLAALTAALKDGDTYVRRDAARALGHFGADASGAMPALIGNLKDREPSVRSAAATALKKIDPAAAIKAGVK